MVITLDEFFGISHKANTIGKGINPAIHSPAMSKQYKKNGLLSLGMVNRRSKSLNWNLLNTAKK